MGLKISAVLSERLHFWAPTAVEYHPSVHAGLHQAYADGVLDMGWLLLNYRKTLAQLCIEMKRSGMMDGFDIGAGDVLAAEIHELFPPMPIEKRAEMLDEMRDKWATVEEEEDMPGAPMTPGLVEGWKLAWEEKGIGEGTMDWLPAWGESE